MKEAIKKEKKTSTLIARFLLWLPGLLLVSFLLLFSVLQVPSVQTKIINSVTEFISSKTSFKIGLGYANLTWYDKMQFEKIQVFDSHDSLMVSVDEARLNFAFFDLLLNKEFNADELIVTDVLVHMIKFSDSTEVNVSRFSRELQKALSSNSENKKKAQLNFGKVILEQGSFTYNDLRKKNVKSGKDYFHFGMYNIQADLKNFTLIQDTLQFHISSFQGNDLTDQLNIRELNGDYFFCKKSMSLYNYELRTDYSTLNDSLSLFYDSPNGLKYFSDSVRIYTTLDQSHIDTRDISLFAYSLNSLDKNFELTGQFKGSVKRFTGKSVALSFGESTSLQGNVSFSGLPKIKETFIDLNINKSLINPNDVIEFIPEKYQSRVLNAGNIDFKGEFLGFPADFVADGTFNTQAGYLRSDVNLKVLEDNTTSYSGNLVLKEFDLGVILSNKNVFQNVNLTGNINGSGLDIQTADFFLNAKVDSIGIRNYVYKDILTNGEFANEFFEGELKINDPNLKFEGSATVDLREDRNKFDFQARLDTLFLKPLGFSSEDIFLASSIDADVKGLHIDSIKGYANLNNLEIHRGRQKLSIDSLKFLSYLLEENRVISIETDGMSGELKGNFKNSTLIHDIRTIISELELNALNNADSTNSYYAQKGEIDNEPFNVDLKFNLWNINHFISPFLPNLKLSEKATLEGFFKSDKASQLSLRTHLDSIYYQNDVFIDSEFEVEISKSFDSKDILASFFVGSREQEWNERSLTENFYIESIWLNNHIDLTANMDQLKKGNKAKLRATIDFLEDSINFSFLNSSINAFGSVWEVNPENKIIYTDSAYYFHDVAVHNSDQSIAINGILSSRPENNIKIDLSNFSIANFNAILPMTLSGALNGVVEVNNLKDDLLVESDLLIDNLGIDGFLVGDIKCLSNWENDQDRLGLSFETVREGKEIMAVNGYFYPRNETDQLALKAVFDDANLNIAQPFVQAQFDGLTGSASGTFDISGKLSSPVLTGKGKVSDGKMRVKYLNTNYAFNGGLIFDENEIGVQNLILYDVEQDSAVLNGGIFHDGFKNFVLDINGEFNHFKMLNTTSVDNKLYYGTAYATGNIDFLGTFKNLQINAKAKTEKGTRISIPIGELAEYNLDQKEYINFVDLNKQVQKDRFQKDDEDEIDLKGVRLNFDIEVNNDAYVELIFDVTAGDIIRGRGSGNLNLQINTTGDFNMFGDFEIESGGYNFTLYNIINKEFDIQKGSQISWYGDPYGAILNIKAKYRQLASLAPLIIEYNNSISESPEISRKYPSIVDLGITGNLLSPDIKFDIDIEDYPNSITLNDGSNTSIELQTVVSAFKSKLSNNEQEMKRQVFSLVILKKFSPENSFTVNSNTIGNSLSEFVSNQLSYWATQVDENLEIDVNLATLDSDAFITFQLRLSYTFLDGRLRVTRGGGFSNGDQENDASSIIGDWTVEYLLTKDGRFRAKMYSRTNLNATNTQLSNNNTQTGFSLQFIRSFDELKRILAVGRDKALQPLKDKKNGASSEALLPESPQQINGTKY